MKRKLLSTLFAAAVALGLLQACAQKEEEGALTLYYPQVTNIGPSMNFISDAPSYHGPKPSAFAITGVTLDGKDIQTDCFSINDASGSVSLSDSEGMEVGSYSLSISCEADGRTWNFKDVFKLRMLPIAPESVQASESVLEIPYSEVKTSDKTISIILVGESVSVMGYELVQEQGKEYFKISKSGVISVNTSFKGDILPGVYPLTLKMKSYAGEAVYENFVTIKVTSKPVSLAYPAESGNVEAGRSFASGVPVMKGSLEDLKYSIKAINPSASAISIDETTGVISVAEGNTFSVGDSYAVDVLVANLYGSEEFASAFTLNVVAFIRPIDPATFSYPETESIQGGAFSAVPASGLVGDELTFELVDLPADLQGQVTIDPASGKVSAARGNSISGGSHEIKVKVSNIKSEAVATLVLTVKANPYFFSYIRYGNNLGLAQDGSYANQYKVSTAADLVALQLVPVTDIASGTPIEWSVKVLQSCSGTAIDASTGALTMAEAGFKANNQGLILVTGVAGKGTEGETSVTVPVFFSFLQSLANGATLDYSPFVIQANPQKGVHSAAPTVSGMADPKLLLLDYRRTFSYYNIAGPATHVGGALKASDTGSFIYRMWAKYFTALNKAVNAGSKDPVSYYSNVANLAQSLLYIDAADKSIVVNANKWMDDDGWANGAFSGQITYVTDGNSGGINNGSQIFPVWIWFDEKF